MSRVNEQELDEYGTMNTHKPSNATIRAANNGNDQRDFTNAQQDAKRDPATHKDMLRVQTNKLLDKVQVECQSDPDDVQRNAIQASKPAVKCQANANAQEIERLKQLAMGGFK